MTTGQRVAQKRKELSLSQEALGEKLGVSRQSIYKWESDSALPEVEKLVALSRLFGVSVGWLLGVEETPAPPGGELSEEQLALAEKLAARYAAPRLSPKRLLALKVSVIAAALCLCGVLWGFYQRLEDLSQSYDRLQGSISQVQSGVNSQIGSISSRVEELLKSQNDITADYGTTLVDVDPSACSASFQVYAVPKHYVEGMTAEFYEAGHSQQTVRSQEKPGQRFTAEPRWGLREDMTIGVIFFYPDGTRQTQVLDRYTGLYGQTFPEAWADYALEEKPVKQGALLLEENQRGVLYQNLGSSAPAANAAVPTAEPETLRVGLFKNRKLVDWAVFPVTPGVVEEETDTLTGAQWAALSRLPENDNQYLQNLTFYFPAQEVPLEAGDVLQEVVVIRDVYGRTAVRSARTFGPDESGNGLHSLGPDTSGAYPGGWMLEGGGSICS